MVLTLLLQYRRMSNVDGISKKLDEIFQKRM